MSDIESRASSRPPSPSSIGNNNNNNNNINQPISKSTSSSQNTLLVAPLQTEKPGFLPKEFQSTTTINDSAFSFKVTLSAEDDPQNISVLHKWIVVAVVSAGALCATCASSMAAFTEASLARTFNVSDTVSILTISLYVLGTGVGPLFVGPLSEVYGRNVIYRVSYGLFFVFSFPVAFAPNIYVLLIFRFITGFCGSAFLSVAGGSVSDLFTRDKVASAMALYTMSPFLGPVLGPLFGGFINQHIDWRWTYYVIIIWSFVQFVALLILVPETYTPRILKQKAARLRQKTGDERYWTEYDEAEKKLGGAILFSLKTPFLLLLTDRMALLLDIWTALLLGILYLAFQSFPFVFISIHGFSMQDTGLTFLGIGVGMILAGLTQPLWNRRFLKIKAKYGGSPPPEVHLDMGKVGGILVALSLYLLAFTSYKNVHWIAPIISSAPFGAGTFLVYTSVFTYLVTSYRPIAASAMAANSALRSIFAAAFPLFARPMYVRLGAVGATALLAGLATLMAPLPFIFSRMGERLRAKSKFAA